MVSTYHELLLLPPIMPATCQQLDVWCGCWGSESWSSQQAQYQWNCASIHGLKTCGLWVLMVSNVPATMSVVSSQFLPSEGLETAWPPRKTNRTLHPTLKGVMCKMHHLNILIQWDIVWVLWFLISNDWVKCCHHGRDWTHSLLFIR
jgi:hypothetical protein